jgi:hypothetical protein
MIGLLQGAGQQRPKVRADGAATAKQMVEDGGGMAAVGHDQAIQQVRHVKVLVP